MDSRTPKKPIAAQPGEQVGDETSVSAPVAPWDPSADVTDDPDTGMVDTRATMQTSAIAIREYELAPGLRLGEYQIEAKIGQGGMGVVWSAVHPLIGKRAAIKILKKELCADPGSLERFVDEARVVNQIGHPNIVDVFAFGEMPDGRSYFVMEWLKGETLRARIARSRMDLDEVRSIIKPLARALQAAHDKGVIHRDLKPDNVFLVDVPDDRPTAKLLDFGIAKLAKNDHRVEKTATGAIIGTPQYIAPEQAKGYAIDPRADIYALGAILFELITGQPPFVADNAMEMVAKHLMEAPVRPSTLVRGLPPELDDLVLRMLAKTPDKRPSLGEVVAVLERSRASASTLPFDRLTPPPPKSDPATPIPSGIVDTPVPARRDASQAGVPTLPTRVPSRRPAWVIPAILGVPLVGVAAFLLVSNLGGSPKSPPPEPTPPAKVVAPAAEPTPVSPPAPTPPERAPDPKPDPVPDPTPVKTVEKTGTLRIDIANAGARTTILVDGKAYKPDMELAYGVHSVEVRSRGMQPKQLEVRIAGPAQTRRIQLAPVKREQAGSANPPTDADGLASPGAFQRKRGD